MEADAKRISEQIDEELKQERERQRRSKGDVKVRCLRNGYYRRIYA